MVYKDFLMPNPFDDEKKGKKKKILSTPISPVDFEQIKEVGLLGIANSKPIWIALGKL